MKPKVLTHLRQLILNLEGISPDIPPDLKPRAPSHVSYRLLALPLRWSPCSDLQAEGLVLAAVGPAHWAVLHRQGSLWLMVSSSQLRGSGSLEQCHALCFLQLRLQQARLNYDMYKE